MIIKRIPKINSINLNRLEEYLRDGKDALPGENHGPKCAAEYTGGLGFVSNNWEDRLGEIEALQASYSGNSDPLQHWVMSWPSDEKPTPLQVKEAWEIFSEHQGMSGHQLLFTVHKDSEFLHSHAILNRITPEPSPTGEYRLEWSKGTVGSVQRKSGERHTNQALCAAVAVAEISTRQGWSLLENRKFNWSPEAGHTKHIIDENPNKIRLGSRVETFEALNPGVKHPKRILAETTLQIIREAKGDKTLAVSMLTAQGITYKDEDYVDNKGRRHIGGVVNIGKDKVKISALPKLDRWIAKLPPIQEPIVIAPVSEPIILTHKEDVNSSSNDMTIDNDLSKVNEKSIKIQSESPLTIEETPQVETTKPLTWKEKQEVKASMLETASTLFAENALKGRVELEKVLLQADIRIIEATTTINNDSGEEKEIVYGQIETQGVTAPLSALGKNEDGKSLYSLGSLNKIEKEIRRAALINEVLPIVENHSYFGRENVEKALQQQGISLIEATATITKDDGTEGEVVYGKLEKDGISISLSALGKDEDKKALYGLGALNKNTRLRAQEALVSEALPVVQNYEYFGREAVETALKQSGISIVEATVEIEKEDGTKEPITYGKISKNGIEVSLSALGKNESGQALYGLGTLNRNTRSRAQEDLINDALPIIDKNSIHGLTAVATALSQHGIELKEETLTKEDESTITYGKLERDGVSISLKSLGQASNRALYSLGSLDFTEKLLKQEALRNEALPLITKASPQGYQAVADALKNRGIEITQKEIMMKDKITNEEKTMSYTALQRNGIEISLSSLGKNQDGHSLFTENELRRVQLAREAANVIDTSANWREAKPKFEELGITHSRVKTHGKDGTEYIVDAIEKDGVSTTLSKAGEQYRPAQIDSKYLPYAEARALFEQTRLQKDPVKSLTQQGYTAPEIDRIRRVGEKAEDGRKDPKTKDGTIQAKPSSSKSVIPSSMNEILDEIISAATDASRLARTLAERNRAMFEAQKARKEAQLARVALEELKASIAVQAPKNEAPVPTPQGDKSPEVESTKNNDTNKDREIAKEREKSLERQREREKSKQRERERQRAKERM